MDENGVPSVVNSVGQLIGSSVDSLIIAMACVDPCDGTENLDTDQDGIADACDLDDDNDGILDVNELIDCTGAQIEWSHNQDGGQGDGASFSPETARADFANTSTAIFGSGLDETTDNYAFTYLLRNADAQDLSLIHI